MQIVVSIADILMMTALAYYRSWSKNADKAPTKIKPMVAAAGGAVATVCRNREKWKSRGTDARIC